MSTARNYCLQDIGSFDSLEVIQQDQISAPEIYNAYMKNRASKPASKSTWVDQSVTKYDATIESDPHL